jgi:hypothetical protein
MRHGKNPKDAVKDALERVAHNFGNDRARLDKISINFYCLRNDGEFAGGTLWKSTGRPTSFAVNDGTGPSRLEPCQWLLER